MVMLYPPVTPMVMYVQPFQGYRLTYHLSYYAIVVPGLYPTGYNYGFVPPAMPIAILYPPAMSMIMPYPTGCADGYAISTGYTDGYVCSTLSGLQVDVSLVILRYCCSRII